MPGPWTPPTVARHYSHIRVALWKYSADSLTTAEQALVQNSVDIAVPANGDGVLATWLKTNFPNACLRALYTNLSNIYGQDTGFQSNPGPADAWKTYALANSIPVENGYLHTASPVSSSNRLPSQYQTDNAGNPLPLARPIPNVSNAQFRTWAQQYYPGLLTGASLSGSLALNPPWNTIFFDNNGSVWPNGGSTAQPVEYAGNSGWMTTWANDYGTLLSLIVAQIPSEYVFGNIGGNPQSQDNIVTAPPTGWPWYWDESAIQLGNFYCVSWENVILTNLNRRAALASPRPYAMMDVHPGKFTTTDTRAQMTALAAYHCLSDPTYTFFSSWGGNDPAGDWIVNGHWWNAIKTNIGLPVGPLGTATVGGWCGIYAQGSDPQTPASTYRVYGRQFQFGLAFFKPVSGINFSADGLNDLASLNATGPGSSQTTHDISQISPGTTWYLLNADGSQTGPVTSITLRNAEGVILVSGNAPPPGSVFQRRKSAVFDPRYIWHNKRRRY